MAVAAMAWFRVAKDESTVRSWAVGTASAREAKRAWLDLSTVSATLRP